MYRANPFARGPCGKEQIMKPHFNVKRVHAFWEAPLRISRVAPSESPALPVCHANVFQENGITPPAPALPHTSRPYACANRCAAVIPRTTEQVLAMELGNLGSAIQGLGFTYWILLENIGILLGSMEYII